MREIKFRGLTAKGEMVYGDLVRDLPNSTNYYNEYSQRICWHLPGGGQSNVPVKNGTVGQYIGLKSYGGEEIYEGDIVVANCCPFFDDGELIYVGVVEMIYTQWQYVLHCINPNRRGISHGVNYTINEDGFEDDSRTCWEIIGNIYQNPERKEVYEKSNPAA